MTIEALAAVLFGLILYDDDLAVLHVITEGEGIADPETFAAPRHSAQLLPKGSEHEQRIAPQLRRSGIGAHDIRRWCWR